jgi:tetratricopeptide (TPR) repeat protein
VVINSLLAQTLYLLRRYDEALTQCKKALELDKNFIPAHLPLAMVYQQQDRHEQAIKEFKQMLTLSGGAPRFLALTGAGYIKLGANSEAQNILEALKKMHREHRADAGDMALIYTGMDDRDRAFEWLEKAYQERSWVVLFLVDPFYDKLRSDSRFTDLLGRVNGKH